MKNHEQNITKEMVHRRLCFLITSLATEYELSVVQGHLHKKKIEYARSLLEKLSGNKVPPALIYAQMKKNLTEVRRQAKVYQTLRREISLRISNPINLN